MTSLQPETFGDPDREQRAGGAKRFFYSGRPTEVAGGHCGNLFTSFSLQQSTQEALKPARSQRQTLEGLLTCLLSRGPLTLRADWDTKRAPNMHANWDLELGGGGRMLAGHTSRTGKERAVGVSLASKLRPLPTPGCRVTHRASLEARGSSGVEMAVGPQLQVRGRTCSAELHSDLRQLTHLQLGFRDGSAPVAHQDEEGNQPGQNSPPQHRAALKPWRAISEPNPALNSQKPQVRPPMSGSMVAHAFLTQSMKPSRLRWGIHCRRVERPAVVAARTIEIQEPSAGASKGENLGKRIRGGDRGRRKPQSKTQRRQMRSVSRTLKPPLGDPEVDLPPLGDPDVNIPPVGHSPALLGSANGNSRSLLSKITPAPAVFLPLSHLPSGECSSQPATESSLVGINGEDLESHNLTTDIASSRKLPGVNPAVPSQPRDRQGGERGRGRRPQAQKNGLYMRLLLPVGPKDVLRYRMDVRRRLALGMHISADISTLGKQQQQVCKLRLSRSLGANMEAGAQMQLRGGAIAQRGVRLAGTGRDGPRWQCSATSDRQAGLRFDFKAGGKQMTSPLLTEKGLLGRAAISCSLRLAPAWQDSKLNFAGCFSF